MVNFNKFILMIASLISFNTELIQAGGFFSKGFPSEEQQRKDDETERKREVQLAQQRAASAQRRAEINRKKDATALDVHNKQQAAIQALKALPEMQKKYLGSVNEI